MDIVSDAQSPMVMSEPSPANKAAEYRQQAESIRAIARQISLLDTKRQLLDAAQHLEVLVEEEERRAKYAAAQLKPKPDV